MTNIGCEPAQLLTALAAKHSILTSVLHASQEVSQALRSERRSDRRFTASGERLRARDLSTDNGDDRRAAQNAARIEDDEDLQLESAQALARWRRRHSFVSC